MLGDGSRFEGGFSHGMWHGEGYRKTADGRVFRGRFDRGVLRAGVLRYPSGAMYMYKVGTLPSGAAARSVGAHPPPP